MRLASFGIGFTLGFGTGFISRELFPIVREIVSPLAKLGVKGMVRGVEGSREIVGHFAELVEDTIAEVRSQLQGERSKKSRIKVKRGTRQPPVKRVPEVMEVKRTA